MACAPPFEALGAWEDALGNPIELISRGGHSLQFLFLAQPAAASRLAATAAATERARKTPTRGWADMLALLVCIDVVRGIGTRQLDTAESRAEQSRAEQSRAEQSRATGQTHPSREWRLPGLRRAGSQGGAGGPDITVLGTLVPVTRIDQRGGPR
jgi:hypothetical protein